ncbi:TOBE domain-containing protein [Achromobacter aegrifaciens]
MNQGRIQQDGTPDDLYDAPANAFVAGFVGSPAINLVTAQPAGEGFAINGQVLPGSVRYRAASGYGPLPNSLTLGIRPEYLRIGEEGLPAAIELVERLGTEQVVTLQACGVSLRVKLDSEVRYRAGDRVNLSLDWSRVHLFDADNGNRIEPVRADARPLREKFA